MLEGKSQHGSIIMRLPNPDSVHDFKPLAVLSKIAKHVQATTKVRVVPANPYRCVGIAMRWQGYAAQHGSRVPHETSREKLTACNEQLASERYAVHGVWGGMG